MKNIFLKILVALVIACSSVVVIAGHHQVSATPDSVQGQGFEISPPLIDLATTPGRKIPIKLKLTNITDTSFRVSAKVYDFEPKGESGAASIIEDPNAERPFSLKSWIADIGEFDFAPKEKKEIDVIVDVPENAEPGGHFGLIRFSGKLPDVGGSQVGLSASIDSLILLRVAGETDEKLFVKEFYTTSTSDTLDKQMYFEKAKLVFATRLENSGNVHVKPVGNIEIFNIFNKKIANVEFNSSGGNVLPGSVRRFENNFEGEKLFGPHRAQLTLTYGAGHTVSSEKIIFWVLPYKIIALSLVILILLMIIITKFIRKYRKYAKIAKKVESDNDQPYPEQKNNNKEKATKKLTKTKTKKKTE